MDGKPVNPFYAQVYEIVGQVPRGKVVSYGQIARALGRPRSSREVGRAMRICPEGLPWQRVVMADGSVTGGGYAELRRMFLEEEGVPFLPDGRVDMSACRWDGC
ncbi:MAG: MGMT family protein [Oscillospiraceae bacterium]|jgi:methylated-DNA-protein-cysteine methyltransferase-like protein|nr:MGMT family protein [Oscillospiraceae bacterium]